MKLYSIAMLIEFKSKEEAAPFLEKAAPVNLQCSILLKASTVLAQNADQAYAIATSFVSVGVVCSTHVTEIPPRVIQDFHDQLYR
jgi:hypothetical protein